MIRMIDADRVSQAGDLTERLPGAAADVTARFGVSESIVAKRLRHAESSGARDAGDGRAARAKPQSTDC